MPTAHPPPLRTHGQADKHLPYAAHTTPLRGSATHYGTEVAKINCALCCVCLVSQPSAMSFDWGGMCAGLRELRRLRAAAGEKGIYKPISCTFIYCCPLIKVFSVFQRISSQTVIRHFFDIYLHFFARYKQFRIPPYLLSWRLFCLYFFQSHPLGCIYHSAETAFVMLFQKLIIYPVPAISFIAFVECLFYLTFFSFCVPCRATVRTM